MRGGFGGAVGLGVVPCAGRAVDAWDTFEATAGGFDAGPGRGPEWSLDGPAGGPTQSCLGSFFKGPGAVGGVLDMTS